MKRMSWKYIAGFVDGEGCLDMQLVHNDRAPQKMACGAAYLRPRLRIAQAAPGKFVLDQLKANFGGSISVRNKDRVLNAAWSESYSWEFVGRRIRGLLQDIVNHMYIKREQARFTIWVIDNIMDKNVGPDTRQVIRDEMSAMKSDPQRLSERAIAAVQQSMRQSTQTEAVA